jgi:superfamily II DNA helicase RecQ
MPAAAAASLSYTNNNTVKIPHSSTVRSNIPYQELYSDAQRVLQETFGLDKLRNLQPAAIRCALQLKSQIIVMATGGGKSLCYQLPATVLGGVTLVISPLIALMQDQVQALNQKGIPAALVSSSQTETQNRAVLERLLGRSLLSNSSTSTTTTGNKRKMPPPSSTSKPLPPLMLLYITPESIQTQRFRLIMGELYQQRRIAMFAIDEAHCISR